MKNWDKMTCVASRAALQSQAASPNHHQPSASRKTTHPTNVRPVRNRAGAGLEDTLASPESMRDIKGSRHLFNDQLSRDRDDGRTFFQQRIAVHPAIRPQTLFWSKPHEKATNRPGRKVPTNLTAFFPDEAQIGHLPMSLSKETRPRFQLPTRIEQERGVVFQAPAYAAARRDGLEKG